VTRRRTRAWRLVTVAAVAAALPSPADASMAVRLAISPNPPQAGRLSRLTLETYTPYAKAGGGYRLEPAVVVGYPFRISATTESAAHPRTVQIRISPSDDPHVWAGFVRFPRTGSWTIHVENFGPRYEAAAGAVLKVRVVAATGPTASATPPLLRSSSGPSVTRARDLVELVLRWSLGAILLLAGLAKLQTWKAFRTGIAAHGLQPALTPPAAAVVVLAETVVGSLLLAGALVRPALAGACVLFGVFSLTIAFALVRGKRIPCHCFGADESEAISALTIARSLALLVMAASAIGLYRAGAHLPSAGTSLAAAVIAAGVVTTARLLSVVEIAWRAFTMRPRLAPTPTGRRSFKHQPLSVGFGRPRPNGSHVD
jgi:uncharacterized membrane protein YphA (DoxX/SURF4 family)